MGVFDIQNAHHLIQLCVRLGDINDFSAQVLAALKSFVWNNMLEKDTEPHLSLRLTEVAKACHLLLAFSLLLGLLLFL